MPLGKVWIYRLLCVFCLFVRLRISPPRIKLAASYFERRFIGIQGGECVIFGNFASPEAQNRTNRPGQVARAMAAQPMARACVTCALATRTVGMCGYTAVSEDGRTCLNSLLYVEKQQNVLYSF